MRNLQHSRDHVLTAEELKTVWLFTLQPRHHSQGTDCLWFFPGSPDNERITGVKGTATVGRKLSGLPRDDCKRYSLLQDIVRCYFRDYYQSVGATYWLHLQLSNLGNYISTSTLVPWPIWTHSPNKTKIYFFRIQRGVVHTDTNRMAYFCIQKVPSFTPRGEMDKLLYLWNPHALFSYVTTKHSPIPDIKIFFSLFSVQACFRASRQPSVGKGFAVWPGLESELRLQSKLKLCTAITALLLCR